MSKLYGQEQFQKFQDSVNSKKAQIAIRNWDVIPEFDNGNAAILGVGGDYEGFEGVHVIKGRKLTPDEAIMK